MGNLKLAAAVLTLSMLSTMPAWAASFDAVPKTGVDERVLEDETIKRVPQEVIDYWVRLGGRLEFADSLVVNGVLADGVYWKGGSNDNLIKVSRRMLNQGFVGSTAYSLVHEIGHFVWFNGSPSEEDIRICEEYYNYYGPYSPSVTSKEEAFATMYARYKNGTYGMSEEEMQCVERVEQFCIERSMGEVGPGVESKFHYRGVWGQDGDKWYYEENGERLKDCDAVVFWHDRTNWTGGTRNMYHFNSDGYMEATS